MSQTTNLTKRRILGNSIADVERNGMSPEELYDQVKLAMFETDAARYLPFIYLKALCRMISMKRQNNLLFDYGIEDQPIQE